MARKNPRRNITRVASAASSRTPAGGWEVRFQRRGQRVARYFSDASHGGQRAALHAAKSFRDAVEANLPRLSAAERARTPTRRNHSGTVGVRLERRNESRGETLYEYVYWVAQWTDGKGRRRVRTFSVARHGRRRAFRLAARARRLGVRRASGPGRRRGG